MLILLVAAAITMYIHPEDQATFESYQQCVRNAATELDKSNATISDIIIATRSACREKALNVKASLAENQAMRSFARLKAMQARVISILNNENVIAPNNDPNRNIPSEVNLTSDDYFAFMQNELDEDIISKMLTLRAQKAK